MCWDSGEERDYGDSSGEAGTGESQGVLCVLGTQGRGGTVGTPVVGLGTHNQRMGGTVMVNILGIVLSAGDSRGYQC